ncbi:MAG: hypothetical protein V1717_04085 [Candidatus Micrarchaeota archaeon]
MTVVGDEIVKSCRDCWSQHSFGIRLKETQGGALECPHCKRKYRVERGFLETI